MKYKKVLKAALIQLVIITVLICLVEICYFTLLKSKPGCGYNRFSLPLTAIPYQHNNMLGYINPADTSILLYSVQYDSGVSSINYSFGADHWRISKNNDSANYYAVFVGCSYTFGYGLNDSETIAAKFAEYNPDYHTYNFSANGYGTGNVLAGFENHLFKKPVKQCNGICIYTFIDYHINRNIGDMNSVGNWAADFPCYTLKDDSVIYKGSFKTARPITTALEKLLAKSNFVKYYGSNFPTIQDKDLGLTALMIKKAATLYKEQFGNDNFYVLIYPNQYFDIRPYLKEEHVKYIDFPGLNLTEAKYKLWCDNHPSALAIDTVTRLLTRQLKADSLQSLPRCK